MNTTLSTVIAVSLIAGLAVGDSAASPARAQPTTPVLIPCKYPKGWNSTDASRDVNGTPDGYDHQCVVQLQGRHVVQYRVYQAERVLIPCKYLDVTSSINPSRDFFGQPIAIEYQCAK